MESMTGYSYTEVATKQFVFSLEIKTLNTKYQEAYINLPRILRYEENAVNDLLKKYFKRGKIELTLDIFEWKEQREIQVNTDLIRQYYEALTETEKKLKTDKSFTLDPILSFDGVLVKGRTTITEESMNRIYQEIEKSCKKTVAMRKQEGKTVEKDIASSLKTISANLMKIKKLSSYNTKEQFEKLKKRILDTGCKTADESRLYTEIALIADKLDINEETSRLSNHIKKFKELMKQDTQLGKQLDFLSQEMFREINTIASKSNSSDISHYVVEVKNNIDKIREQCRNIV